MHTDERMEAFTRFLLYPAITAIVHGLAALEKLRFEKQSVLAADTSLPEAQRGLHSAKATRSRTKLLAMAALAAAPGELCQVSQCASAFFDVNDTLDAAACPTDRAGKENNRVRTALANAFKAESGVMTVLQRTSGISSEFRFRGRPGIERNNPLFSVDELIQVSSDTYLAAVRADIDRVMKVRMMNTNIFYHRLYQRAPCLLMPLFSQQV